MTSWPRRIIQAFTDVTVGTGIVLYQCMVADRERTRRARSLEGRDRDLLEQRGGYPA